MPKIVIFSDLHAHPWPQYSTILPNGLNSRARDAIDCLDQVLTYASNIRADLVLFGGDMFHEKKRIDVKTYDAVYRKIEEHSLRDENLNLVMLHGNHDNSDREGNYHSLRAFSQFGYVFDKAGWLEVSGRSGTGYNILGIPYTESLEDIREIISKEHKNIYTKPDYTFLLGHLGIQGGLVGSDYVYQNPYDPTIDDLQTSKFDAAFLGHFHLPQQLNSNSWYISAPAHHNWGDVGQVRGFRVYDTETRHCDLFSLRAPKFVELDNTNKQGIGNLTMNPTSFVDDYVRIKDTECWSADRIEAMKDIWKCRSLEIDVRAPPKKSQTERQFKVSISTPASEMIANFVDSGVLDTADLDEEYLIKLGQDIIGSSEG